ncbi:zinc ribbon domain-containing protein [Candidatus Peregrinibacteria bacterium]|nr:zinc ribbon domain-containing protein [Candidatus Peregrinibacteria bacterium]MBT3599143.1 zinc ribbon domain-containing protein [Candidatus Peregrinibacteria bacterium]MBT4367088.1 zinc ribbon domain-containing protein [Candidatus Peregrinibacteria bacterium]MBT4585957.1 zinc ribbon domain-containing protein [Candidatus Peregrinibacteria bacterium]MBT6730783.1 zinc ribbon domain-containing protein [Candidatus Peregrinibacteria bacterium]
MPTFDFSCKDCGHVFEFSRPFGDKVIPPCPKCGSMNVVKLIAPPSIQFVGEGFYKTDSAPKQNSDKAEEKPKDSNIDKKDNKPAKTEPKPEKSIKKDENR